MKTLKELNIGSSGVVAKLNASGQLKQRLLDMGITKGTRIKIIKIAPLGDPIEVEIRGYNLSVRKLDAESIDIDESSIITEEVNESKKDMNNNKKVPFWKRKKDKEVK